MTARESHGGNIYRAAEELRLREETIIDFSASVNPLGVPKSVRVAVTERLASLVNYPDPDATRLRRKIAEREDLDPENIICGNGSTELIYLVARAFKPQKVLIPAPTFGEYERACTRRKSTVVVHHPLMKENAFRIDPDNFVSAMEGCDAAFFCNPNNPTGGLVGRDDMLVMTEGGRRAGCLLVVDEAFIDFSGRPSLMREAQDNPYLLVIRSLTKFYALAGLRIGYMVLARPHVEKVREAKEPWTVNTLAQVAALAALADRTYEAETRRVMAEEKRRLEEGFSSLGITWFPSAANYYLISLPEAQVVREYLRRKGILTRDCSNFVGLDETFLRVAVKSRQDNLRFLKEMAACVE
jgi:threonine-phosphate decarboxylase